MKMTDTSLLSLIQAGLVWSTTLAWSDVVRTGTSYIYPNDKEKALEAELGYAVILTIIVILIFYFLQKTASELKSLEGSIVQKINDMQSIQKQSKLFV